MTINLPNPIHDPARARRFGYRDARMGLKPIPFVSCDCYCAECLAAYAKGHGRRKAGTK